MKKECKRGTHKYIYQLNGRGDLLNKYKDFACIKCGLNWNFDDTKAIVRVVRNNACLVGKIFNN